MAKKSAAYKTDLPKEVWLKWYKDMLLWRRVEEKAGMVYTMGKIKGFLHLYIGQEALVAGACQATRPDDNMITAYRNHIHPLGKGMEAKYMMAELYGKSTGCSKGMGGSMHMFSKELRFFGGHGIVGGQIPLGAGLGFADAYRGEDRVTLCYMGDGAVRQGAFHETLNLAMLWKIPTIFIIENNRYAMGTSVERTSNVTDLTKLGLSFEMPSVAVNGMRCDDVYYCLKEAVERARKGEGPTLVEAQTYRYKGHSMSDPQKYRTKDEVEKYKAEDPILHALFVLQSNNWISDSEVEAIDEAVKQEVEECVAFAESSPYPDPEDLWKYVYKQEDYPFIREF
jgi:pyruvate dehydrogenase E1 component alpha subunit